MGNIGLKNTITQQDHLSVESLGDFYRDYESRFFHHKNSYEHTAWRLNALLSNKNSKILDVGAGGGATAMLLKKYGHHDISACENFSGNLEHHPDPAYWGWGDISRITHRLQSVGISLQRLASGEPNGSVPPVTKLPYEDNQFDLVYHSDVIEHVTDVHSFLSENARIIKEGGYIFIKTPNAISLRHRIQLLLGRNPYVSLDSVFDANLKNSFYGAHIREFSLEELSYMVSNTGFRIIEKTHLSYSLKHKIPSYLNPSFAEEIFVIGMKLPA